MCLIDDNSEITTSTVYRPDFRVMLQTRLTEASALPGDILSVKRGENSMHVLNNFQKCQHSIAALVCSVSLANQVLPKFIGNCNLPWIKFDKVTRYHLNTGGISLAGTQQSAALAP